MYKILKGETLKKFKNELSHLNPNILIEPSDTAFIIIPYGKKILGYAILKEDNILKDIFIKSENRYSSHGTKLIKFIVNYLSTMGINQLHLHRYEENPVFFKKVGFKKHSEFFYKIDNLLVKSQRKKEGINSTLLSIFVNIFLSFIKVYFGIVGKSKALVADGFHSMSDIVGSLVVLVGVHLGNKPADENHPYGHGKLESVAGNIIGVILIITAYTLIVDNIQDYYHETIREIPQKITIIIALLSIIIKYILYKYKYYIGKKIKSDAVLADAKEHKSDVLSSVGVLIGILLSIYISPIFDLLLSIVVGIIIGKEGFSIILQTSNNLMDVQDKGFINEVKEYVESFELIENCHDVKMTASGNTIYLSLHIRLDGKMTIRDGHKISDNIRFSILTKFENVEDVTIHVDCSI